MRCGSVHRQERLLRYLSPYDKVASHESASACTNAGKRFGPTPWSLIPVLRPYDNRKSYPRRWTRGEMDNWTHGQMHTCRHTLVHVDHLFSQRPYLFQSFPHWLAVPVCPISRHRIVLCQWSTCLTKRCDMYPTYNRFFFGKDMNPSKAFQKG